MTWAELQSEYRQYRIGSGILSEIEQCVAQVVRRYDPDIYAGASSWTDGRQDVVQELVATALLGERQLEFIMSTAVSLDDFRRLMKRQVHRTLVRMRRRTVIDNLLDRTRPILAAHPFATRGQPPGRVTYTIGDAEEREPTEEELWRTARLVAAIPTAPFGGGERASMVFTTEALTAALRTIADCLPPWFTQSHVGRIFEMALTDWLPSPLTLDEEAFEIASEELETVEQVMADDLVRSVLNDLGRDERLILKRKLAGVPDEDVAVEVGVSRPTLAKRKHSVLDCLQKHLVSLDERTQELVVATLQLRLALEEGMQ